MYGPLVAVGGVLITPPPSCCCVSLQLFGRLDAERSDSEDKWKAVAKTLQAIKWYFLLTVPKEEAEPSEDQVWLTYSPPH